MQNNALKTFDLVIKAANCYFGTRLKVFKLIELVPVANFWPYLLANSTFNLVSGVQLLELR
jgi:hypothetical protein